MSKELYHILSKIDYPADLKKLSEEELVLLASEIRSFIVQVISSQHGHLASSLGVVELSIAIHFVFNAPYDKIIWDVGHQAYPHKILTGRKHIFHTNRKLYGISGFPKMSESEYDAFGVGHSSTSISAALGMAEASRIKGETDRQHVAVIGDGAMTAGMAIEALNNAGVSHSNLLVILNDNGIAIDPNVGAIHKYLTNISTSQTYNKIKDDLWNLLGKFDKLGSRSQWLASKIEAALKTALLKNSNMFESLNFRYFGPIDGHDIPRLVKVLNDLKKINGPKVLHIITKKGKGLPAAENDPVTFHAPGIFDKETGLLESNEQILSTPYKFQDVFGLTLLELAEQDERVVGITPAMSSGSSFHFMKEKFPGRVFDVGIAEQHAVTFSAGLASAGLIPFCNIYSTFMQRAYDQVIHDVALQSIPVIFCLDRAGLVGEDGPTHHGAFDLAYFRNIPNMIIAAPLNECELRHMMLTAKNYGKGPISIRFPRGLGYWKRELCPMELIPIGKARQLIWGEKLAILSLGTVGNDVLAALNLLEGKTKPSVFDMRFLKPLDEELIQRIFAEYSSILTIEDGSLIGGLASAIAEMKVKYNFTGNIKNLGIPDSFVEHGSTSELKKICGFDKDAIINAIKYLI